MKYCTPWQEELACFWVMRDLHGDAFAIVCSEIYPVNPIASACYQTAYYIAFIEHHGSVAEAKKFIDDQLPTLNEKITIINDKRLLVML